MQLDSVRSVKNDAQAVILQMLQNNVSRRALGVRAQSIEMSSHPRSIALGVANNGSGDYKLAVRVQNQLLLQSDELDAIRLLARNEVDVRYIGFVQKLQAPWNQQRCRPVRIGCSVGHYLVTAGTVGAFVTSGTDNGLVLSNNHVLANENRATVGDPILQPGKFDNGQDPVDEIATLAAFIPISFTAPNAVDCAVASLNSGIGIDSQNLDTWGQLAGVRSAAVENGLAVGKIGRTTGSTRGTVTAFELDNVTVGYDQGTATFNGQIEIEGAGATPFSRGGDSGSLIFDPDKLALGLLFAGGEVGGSNGQGLTFANPISAVLQGLSVSFVI